MSWTGPTTIEAEDLRRHRRARSAQVGEDRRTVNLNRGRDRIRPVPSGRSDQAFLAL
jgi:hypothetical protein